MRRLLVPGTVFPPVIDRDLLPGVVEVVGCRENLHLRETGGVEDR